MKSNSLGGTRTQGNGSGLGSSGCSPLARKRFYELYNLACGCGHWGLAVGEEMALPLGTSRGQCHTTAKASPGPKSLKTSLTQALHYKVTSGAILR